MAIHACPDCGLIHGLEEMSRESPDVQIARIQADKELAIARLMANADKHVADVQAEATVDAAKAEAKAIEAVYADEESDERVAQALTAMEENIDPAPEEPVEEPTPEVIVNDAQVNEVPEPPRHEEHHEPPAKKKAGLGLW